ncbi:hypothetical protein [Ancylobacter oerskovii]|uniref:Uncharacterized protein n=1 Tax=Ancylobacter oerskovii TaxID=459519 RepID=A0ABW4Z321_9HYPH|nr:hypothetical protein [Ancylobacter oerskovii]MBS7546284.1 hypothetical protein [Ancylobacter oerskovii]
MLIDPDYGQAPIADRATTRRDLILIIDRAIEVLDALEGDADAEHEFGWTLGVNQDDALAWCTLDPSGTAEPDDDGGGDINDEPHDAEDEDTGIADPDALHLRRDERWFSQQMEDTRVERRTASESALHQLADMTGRPQQATSFPRITFRPRRSRGDIPVRYAEVVNGQLVEVAR